MTERRRWRGRRRLAVVAVVVAAVVAPAATGSASAVRKPYPMDVAITSTAMRKVNLLHAIVSFFFNTVLVAAAVNAAVSLAS